MYVGRQLRLAQTKRVTFTLCAWVVTQPLLAQTRPSRTPWCRFVRCGCRAHWHAHVRACLCARPLSPVPRVRNRAVGRAAWLPFESPARCFVQTPASLLLLGALGLLTTVLLPTACRAVRLCSVLRPRRTSTRAGSHCGNRHMLQVFHVPVPRADSGPGNPCREGCPGLFQALSVRAGWQRGHVHLG